jgi:hypothetical protein
VRAVSLLRAVGLCACAALGLSLCSGGAAANNVAYPDQTGTNVVFRSITEDANVPGHPAPLFGPPTVSGDNLYFVPPAAFSANSSNGTPDVADGHLTFRVQAKAGQGVTSVDYSESGYYSLFGPGTVRSAVGVPALLTVMEVNGSPITPLSINPTTSLFTPTATGIFELPQNSNSQVNQPWTGAISFNVAAALQGAGYSGAFATDVMVTLDNSLVAQSTAGTIASIGKQAAQISVNTSPVPVPGSGVLAGIGLACLGWHGWRRRRRGSQPAAAPPHARRTPLIW